MYQRKKFKVGIYRILILLAILIPCFWYTSIPLSAWLSRTLSANGFTGFGYYIGRGTTIEALSQEELAYLKELSLLSAESISNEEKTIFLSVGKQKFSEEKKNRILQLFDSARNEIGPIVGHTPSVVRIRVVKNPSLVGRYGFNGYFIDLPEDKLLDTYTVYHEVTRLASSERLFSWNIPASFPVWFDEGLADYIPSILGKSSDYRLLKREYPEGELSFTGLDVYSARECDSYPASVAVGLIDELSGRSGGVARVMTLLARGAHFVEALRIVTGLTEVEFAKRWEKACNGESLDVVTDSSDLERANFINGKVLYEQACRLIEQRNIVEAIEVLRQSILELDKVAPLAFGGKVAVEKRNARELLAKQLISLNDDRAEPAESQSGKELSEGMNRKSVFATKVIITQLMLLFVVICFYFLKLMVAPLLIFLFSQSFRPGSVIVTCILLFLSLRFLKTMTGLVTCRILLSYGLSKHISYSALLLIYWWLSAFVMLIYGSLLMEHSGGDSGDQRNYIVKAFLSFSSISFVLLVILNFLGYIRWSLSGNWVGLLVHAILLALFYGLAHESFFRGGLLKSAETKLHVGSSAVLTSLFWAVFITFPDYSPLRLTVAFISGMLFCSLVTSSASISAAVGGASALHFFDWFVLDRGLSVFGQTMFTSVNNANPLLVPALEASFTSLFWVPLVFSGWCLTLIVLKRDSSSRRSNRTSRLFISSEGY